MKPSEIIKLARRQTWCTEDIVTTEEAYRFLNFVIEDFGADIRASDSGHWFDYLQFDVSAGQSTYTMDDDPWEWSNKFPIWKLEKVWYKMPDWKRRDLPIRFVDKIDINDRPNQWEPEICFLINNTINLMPEPKTATKMIIWGYDYNWELSSEVSILSWTDWDTRYNRSPSDDVSWAVHPYAWKHSQSIWYTTNETPSVWEYTYDDANSPIISHLITFVWVADDDEANIFIPKRWHYILVEWLKYWMYGNMWVNFEAARTNSRNFYDSEKMKALQNIMDRWQESDEPYYPFLNFLNY